MKYVIGTDIGTSSTKTVVIDAAGGIMASASAEYGVETPRPLWAQQWPQPWVEAVKSTVRRAVTEAGLKPGDVAGLCVSGLYGGSGVPLEADMEPVRPCIIWMDRRASAQQKWVEENIGFDRVYAATHNGTDPYYGYTKIMWIRDNEPENWAKIKLFLPPNAYAIYKLTGEAAVDYSSAGNIGGVWNAAARKWDAEMLGLLGIPASMMPARVVGSNEAVGGLTAEAAAELGLLPGTPVFSGGVDCAAAALGMGVLGPGSYAAAIGTSMCAAFVHEGTLGARGLIEMPFVVDPGRLSYSFGGAATAGAIVKWFRDEFARDLKAVEAAGGGDAYRALDNAAAGIGPGSGGVVVLPYFMGERSPVWDVDARGVIFGLSLSHGRGHVYRAFLEAVAYSLRHTMEEAGAEVGDTVTVAGGAARSPLWRQIIADVTGRGVVCPKSDAEACYGAAIQAGVGAGLFTYKDVASWDTLGPRLAPDPAARGEYGRYYAIYRELYENLKGMFKKL